jgi:uncharacterized membrane protein
MENELTKNLRAGLSKKRESLNRFYLRSHLNSPGKGLAIAIVLIWIVGSILFYLSMPDLSAEQILGGREFFYYFLYALFTLNVVRICVAYYRKTRQERLHNA